jgi:glutaminyl-tRNA synthetase
VGLKHVGLFVRCDEVVRGPDGGPCELRVSIDLASAERPKKQSPKGVLQWVPDEGKVELAEVRLYERLFTAKNVTAEPDWLAALNPASLERVRGALGEPAVTQCKEGSRVQFERLGYFAHDKDSTPRGLVFNRIVTLKESKDRAAIKPA